MTTLVALSTRDALVMGCDSLASTTAPFVDPHDLIQYFDKNNNWNLKLGQDGEPLLKNYVQVYDQIQNVPYDHMTHVGKLFTLEPLEMGVMMAGAVSIGDRTIKSLINEFKTRDIAFKQTKPPTNYTVRSVAKRLLSFIWKHYVKQYPDGTVRPALELLIGGYDKQKQIPTILRVHVNENKIEGTIKDFGIVFGGQMREIQRIVFGSDYRNKEKIVVRFLELIGKYHERVCGALSKRVAKKLPTHDELVEGLPFFGDWDLDAFDANWGDFSEQNAIECVDFFIDVMIKSQQFSARLPIVGGDVHVALITKTGGFKFVSREELRHEQHTVSLVGERK